MIILTSSCCDAPFVDESLQDGIGRCSKCQEMADIAESEDLGKWVPVTEWVDCKERQPDQFTRYASTYGVGILGIDMNEPNPTPGDANFMWKEGFQELCPGWSENSDWMPSSITHWMEMPDRPKCNGKTVHLWGLDDNGFICRTCGAKS